MRLLDGLKHDWTTRPWWMNLLFYFCVYMTVIYLPFDLFFKPLAQDHEIWFGFALTGWWAKLTAPIHWLIYGAGAFGFFKMRKWMWPWAAVYAGQVVIAMFVWNLVNPNGKGLVAGLVSALVFAIPMIGLWRAKDQFTSTQPKQSSECD